MIASHCFELDWIKAQREQLKAADPGILEKAIHALALLEGLVRSDCDLVFKGGTALLLHLPEFRRLSIDIDIICSEPKVDFERRLEGIIPGGPFLRWEPNDRGEDRLPKRRHYKLFYNSATAGREDVIVLDVVEEPNVIVDLVQKPILTSFIECEAETNVAVPTVEALLGDKLTAYAPNTVGVPLTERLSLQVVKQLFDVGQLYDVALDLGAIRQANRAVFDAEAAYRPEFSGSYEDYFNDVIDTSMSIACLQTGGAIEGTEASQELLGKGVRQLANHIVGPRFRPRDASVAAAKAAWLAGMLGRALPEPEPEMPRWDPKDKAALKELQQAELQDRFEPIKSLKKINVEAFYHWFRCS